MFQVKIENSFRNIGWLILLILCLSEVNLQAQTKPYGSNDSYSYGFMQAYETNAAADTRGTTWYNQWKSTYYTEDCGGGQARIRNGSGSSSTFSEGQGYGMLLAAYAGDKASFDKLWTFYKNKRNSRGLMHWDVSCGGVNQSNGATDGDVDAAMALLIANYQWPSTTTPHNYFNDATALINAIYDYETNLNGNAGGWPNCTGPDGNPIKVLRPGDDPAWITSAWTCTCINISYFAPGYFRAFSRHMANAGNATRSAQWTVLADDCYRIINANQNTSTHLVSPWSKANGQVPGSGECSYVASGGGSSDTYQYDACRTPWRIATDYLWWGTAAADTWLTNVTNWANTSGTYNGQTGGGGPTNIRTNYVRSTGAAGNNDRNSAFVGAFALGTMANTQALTSSWYQSWVTRSSVSGYSGANALDDGPYFQNSLGTMYMFMASGNFWNPYNGNCLQPNLGADLSTCSGTTLPANLNSNTTDPGASVTYTWYRNGTAISGQTGPTCSGCATVTGTYVVVRDSTGGCSKKDTLVISSTIPAPTITGPLNLCNPTSYNLTPTNLANFPGGTTWQWAVDYTGGTSYNNITGETASTLSSVRRAGRYRLSALAGACSNSGTVVVTSSLATPVDGCVSGSGTTSISVTNPGLNGTNYNWYTSASGSTLATVTSGPNTNTTSISVNVSTTTTYYVQDMSSVSSTAGPSSTSNPLSSASNGGAIGIRFTAATAFNITEVKIAPYVYSCSGDQVTITFQLVNNTTSTTVGSYTATGVPCTGVQTGPFNTYYTMVFPTPIPVATAGNYTLTPSGGNQLPWYAAGANFNTMDVAGVIDITDDTRDDDADSFPGIFDIKVQAGSGCARLPVIVRTTGCTPAPVELVSFYAEKEQRRTILHWATASELNNDYFQVERSQDGIHFEVIGTVKGMGNKSDITIYSYADENTPYGKAYYRLTQFDFDGQNETSGVISIEHGSSQATVEVAPNPFTNSTQILISSKESGKAAIQLNDLSGHSLYSGFINTNEYQSIGETLPAGVYLLQIFIDNNKIINKIIKQ